MNFEAILENVGLTRCVKQVWVMEGKEDITSTIPFYADGFMGIMFQQAENGATILPRGKKLAEIFLYGQTIKPIQIFVEGRYKFIFFQLFPFSTKALFNLDTRSLNDECYDLRQIDKVKTERALTILKSLDDTGLQVKEIAELIKSLEEGCAPSCELRIKAAIELVLERRGKISIKEITEGINITERTLQRLFVEHVGISPKQFVKMIRFQSSASLIEQAEHKKLSDIVFESGYTDQSHLIRNFRQFTEKTPSEFKR